MGLAWMLLLAGCGAVAPDPADVSIDELPVRELDDDARARRDELQQDAIDAVVRRRYPEAERAAERALAIDPRAARARAVLGMVRLQEAGRADPIDYRGMREGEVQVELARRLAPSDAFVGWMHAVFLAETGHMSAAAAAAEDALANVASGAPVSERAALLGIAGTYRYELGEERAARPHLEAYVALRPDDATAQFRLGSTLLRIAEAPEGAAMSQAYLTAQREAEAAAAAFVRCAELAPGDDDAALAVAAARVRAAELAELRAGELKDGAEARAERDGNRAAAADQLRGLAERFPLSPEAPFRLGVVLQLQDEQAAARAAYEAALERDPEHPGALMNLGAMLAAAGDEAGAAALLRRLLVAPRAADELSRDERRRVERWLAERG